MKNFAYVRAVSPEDAVQKSSANTAFIAGGTNLLDRLKVFLDEPTQLVDISRLELKFIGVTRAGGMRIGALASNTVVADHPQIRQNYPLLSRAILSGASQQIRNVATVGGNLLQRTRSVPITTTGHLPAINGNRAAAVRRCRESTGCTRFWELVMPALPCIPRIWRWH